MKPLTPTLREKKRYLVFEVISDKPVAWPAVRKTINGAVLRHIGELGHAKAGMQLLDEQWNKKLFRGMLRTTHTSLDEIRSSLALIRDIEGVPAIVRSVGASGILKRAVLRYLAEENQKNKGGK